MPLRGLRLSEDLKTCLEQVQKLRAYRSVNAFIPEAIKEKLQRMDAVDSVSESEARIAADFSRIVREVRSVHKRCDLGFKPKVVEGLHQSGENDASRLFQRRGAGGSCL
jgi:hypothetical protein